MTLSTQIPKDVFRQICLLFLPGSLVVIPCFILIYLYSGDRSIESLIKYFETHHALLYFIGIILSFIMGFVLENIGSMIEVYLDRVFSVNARAWKLYLLRPMKKDEKDITLPIYEYIESVSFRYSMELSLIPAILIFLIEWALIYSADDNILSGLVFGSVLSISIVILLFTSYQVCESCLVLDSLRKSLDLNGQSCPDCNKSVEKNFCDLCGQSIKR